MSKNILEMATGIIQTRASLSPMSADEIASSFRQISSILMELQEAEFENRTVRDAKISAAKKNES
jgi:hypothetical protein